MTHENILQRLPDNLKVSKKKFHFVYLILLTVLFSKVVSHDEETEDAVRSIVPIASIVTKLCAVSKALYCI